MAFFELLKQLINPHYILETFGYLGLFGAIFAESGLLLGFFLPGDSLLFLAGFLASQGLLQMPILVVTTFVAAVLGDSVGYTFGRRVGRRLFKKDDSLFFHKKNVIRAQKFYEKHGPKTIILARFMPVIRTFAPIVAGIGTMKYTLFIRFNIIGGLIWAVGVPFAGYFFGSLIPDVDKYLLPIIILIIIASIAPAILHIVRDPEQKQDIKLIIGQLVKKIIR